MSIIASVSVPASAFPFGPILESDLEGPLTIETQVPTSEEVIPYLWVPGSATETVLETIEAQSTVKSATQIDSVGDHDLLKIEWTTAVNGFLAAIREHDAIVTSGTGSGDRWTFQLRFPAYEDLSSFYTACLDRDISLELVQLHEAVDPERNDRFGLTVPQRELVVAAYERGYFDVPRATTLVELGEELDISDSAVSQRLRRGLESLVGSTLAIDSETPSGPVGQNPHDR
ncbi:helix-turn-helix domain-containing protein [Halostagnicola kamekurae]|uniref:Predicted DNA binding protein, contains HTH domain n=1 Tax=Halostagnicola kamekurae TaxID=619731 RepID=A0A1I6QC62_9EURY|nr:bacterio-opsin activator domain-containing protein [Halostagnicola kamekurae]SFS50059.1 Predicted DNA binding protein, contains HTH domain [Halostagnicola kamekurae]